jgi:hypothetical protein
MNYSITPSADHKYIIHKAEGIVNRGIMFEQTLEAHALGRELGIDRFLVDLTKARNNDHIGNDFFFAHEDMKKNNGINKSAIVAIITSPEDSSHDFIETTLRSAGQRVKIFKNVDEAMRYLIS